MTGTKNIPAPITEPSKRATQPKSLDEESEVSGMSFDDIVRFLEPLLDIYNCRRVSLTYLMKHREEILLELFETKKPVFLNLNNVTLLLCDTHGYAELENKRQSILAGSISIEAALRVGKMKLPDPRLTELQMLKSEIADSERQLRDTRQDYKQAKRELAALEKRAQALTGELKAQQL